MLSRRTRDDELPEDIFGFKFDPAHADHKGDDETEIHLDASAGNYRFAYTLQEDEHRGSYMVGGQACDATGAVIGRMAGVLLEPQILRKHL